MSTTTKKHFIVKKTARINTRKEILMEKNERERLLILLDHWINHNQGHAGKYLSLAEKLEAEGFNEVGHRLREACDLIIRANQEFSLAKENLAKE